MTISAIEDELKDAICDVISDEAYHRIGGTEQKYFFEGIELILGGIVTAFLIPYLKKLAEKSAEATWDALTASPDKDNDTTVKDSETPENIESLLANATEDDHLAASKIASESVRFEMRKHNFTENAQSVTIQKLLVEIKKISYDGGG